MSPKSAHTCEMGPHPQNRLSSPLSAFFSVFRCVHHTCKQTTIRHEVWTEMSAPTSATLDGRLLQNVTRGKCLFSVLSHGHQLVYLETLYILGSVLSLERLKL